MARSDTVTLIPLDRVAAVLGIDPLHFNSVVSQLRPLRNACDDLWLQQNYQYVGRTSREDLALVLKQAEMQVIAHLGYPFVPMWVFNEDHMITQAGSTDVFNTGSFNVRLLRKSIRARWGYVQEIGRRTVASVSLGAAVVYSDTDGDGYKDRATVVVPTALTNAEELHLYYPGHSGDPRWEIRPVEVSIAGGSATFIFHREQAAIESQLSQLTDLSGPPPQVDGDNDLYFLSSVDVYRVYADTSYQAIMYTEGGCSSCDGSGCDVCGQTAETACIGIRDRKLGILTYDRADWDATQSKFVAAPFTVGREPDSIKIWYRAGWINHDDQDQRNTMTRTDPTLERLIILYAFTLLDSEFPACENTRRIIHRNRENVALNQSSGQVGSSYNTPDRVLNNPFGTTFAAIQLWNYLQTNSVGRLVTAR